MRKYIAFVFIAMFLSSCGNSAQVEQAKQEILSPNTAQNTLSGSTSTGEVLTST